MIKESMFLFLLIGVEGSIEKKYIGRLNHCDESIAVYERMLAEYNNINGFLCLDKADARKLFQHTPTPKQQQITKEIREWLIPKPKPKPPLLKKKESINTNP